MDSMPDFDTKGPGFDSRSLHILFNSFFLLCQVLSETNFPCISTSNFPCECTKKLHQHSSMCQVLSETNFPCISTSNFPCECTKKLHQLNLLCTGPCLAVGRNFTNISKETLFWPSPKILAHFVLLSTTLM